MLKSKLALTVLLASLAGAATAQSEGAAPPKAEKPEKEKKICRTEKATGSLTRVTRICMTQEAWDEMANRTNKMVSRLSESGARADRQASDPSRGDGW